LYNVSDLLRFPEYHFENFPYIIARSKEHLSMINVRTRLVYKLISEQKPNFDNEFSAIVPSRSIEDGGQIYVIFSSTK